MNSSGASAAALPIWLRISPNKLAAVDQTNETPGSTLYHASLISSTVLT
jgi:hypothetical protein